MKPDNALIVSLNADGIACKLGDFGTAQGVNAAVRQSTRSTIVGTPLFLAPEMMRECHLTKGVDVYAFALVIWSAFTGVEPFKELEDLKSWDFEEKIIGGYRPAIPEGFPDALVGLMTRSWSSDVSERPDFKVICETLRNFFRSLK